MDMLLIDIRNFEKSLSDVAKQLSLLLKLKWALLNLFQYESNSFRALIIKLFYISIYHKCFAPSYAQFIIEPHSLL